MSSVGLSLSRASPAEGVDLEAPGLGMKAPGLGTEDPMRALGDARQFSFDVRVAQFFGSALRDQNKLSSGEPAPVPSEDFPDQALDAISFHCRRGHFLGHRDAKPRMVNR